jgi:anti-anti-sigma regulatory factor
MSLIIKSIPEGNSTVLVIGGDLNEDSSFQGQTLTLGQPIVLDMEGVTSINSVGIREWIKWIKTLPQNSPVSLRKAPKIIVDQINMIAGFLPPGTVIESFYVPYFSEETNSEKMVLFTAGQEFNGPNLAAPEGVADEAGNPMEMDVIPAKYFKFLQGI